MNDPKPRRVARLIGAVFGILAGLFYIIFPPNTTTHFFDATWPAIAWGIFFLLGGVISSVAWWNRSLNLDRIGLTCLITGIAGLLFAQTMVMLEYPITYTRGGGTVILAVLAAYLIARWQDVRHDEQEAEAAIRATIARPVISDIIAGERGEDGKRN